MIFLGHTARSAMAVVSVLVPRTLLIVAIIMVSFSTLFVAVMVAASPSAMVMATIIPVALRLILVADDNPALRAGISCVIFVFWWRHGAAMMWRHFFLAVVVVMFAMGRGLGMLFPFPGRTRWNWDGISPVTSLPSSPIGRASL